MNVHDILKDYKKPVVIVHYRPAHIVGPDVYQGCPPPQNPACNLQITLIQDKLSPSGKLMRLGETPGDEISGWTNLEALEVVEVLGELQEDGTTVNPVVPRETLQISA